MPEEPEKLVDASIRALDLDPAQIKSDFAAVSSWLEGKTEADILAAPSAGGVVGDAFAAIKANDEYLHTRSGNIAVLTMMDAVRPCFCLKKKKR